MKRRSKLAVANKLHNGAIYDTRVTQQHKDAASSSITKFALAFLTKMQRRRMASHPSR